MNKFIGHGRLTKDPEVRYTQSGKAVASFTIAMDRPHKQDAQQQADFLPCVAWDKLAEIIGNNLAKGREILVEGRIQTRSYEAQDGSKRYVTECVINNMEFCGSKPQGEQEKTYNRDAASPFGPSIPDEDIPF
jgi:single-strand DNA-binding protein